ncbi:glycosyltransferase family 47 protein [Rheinheimera sp. UJ51]|uniref:exostosin domain-containing protein n=1 Tax=Rheinheimera sp. UJ51 TaxID=2892446 RepID=UPI001E3DD9EE|nr:exostosin family protein [Rheinheimera sp. UJ51]MCC5450279.1 glycosyltransferase family 47 protein [Rheinheimera sp. UJ51]
MSFLVYDKYWQYPAVTELHAFKQLQRCLQQPLQGAVYLAFPWATLFDLKDRNQHSPVFQELVAALSALTKKIPSNKPVVTVCQHIRLQRHLHFLRDAGVTDVFWSHLAEDSEMTGVKLFPFPLYPVHQVHAKPITQRKVLASFVGAKANQYYPSQVRNFLPKVFANMANCVMHLNDSWQFNHVVYETQVKQHQFAHDKQHFQDDAYSQVLVDSVFALCPAGTGPNSIRLWEAITAHVIPVIISNNYLPPGNAALWQQAAVMCEDNEQAIRCLPEQLTAIQHERSHLQEKLSALQQLKFLYGPDYFVADLYERLMVLESQYQLATPIQRMANRVLTDGCKQSQHTLKVSLASHRLLGKSVFHEDYLKVLSCEPN